MKLTKYQKGLVKCIADGRITDILSFVELHNLSYEVCFYKPYVYKRFENAYDGKKFLCDSRFFDNPNEAKRIVERLSERTVCVKPRLNFSGSHFSCSHNNITHSYSLFEPIRITECFDEIVSFIALWQYLKSEALIIELPKSCSKEDMGLFLKRIPDKEKCHVSLDENRKTPYQYHELDIPFEDFFDGKYELNKENFEICLPYLTKKIYPAPELQTFIQNKYNTTDELNNRGNLWIALAGVIIAFITSVASIIVSVTEKGYHNELAEINSSIQEISGTIFSVQSNNETLSASDLQTIEKQLDSLLEKDFIDSETSKKLDELIEAIKELQPNITQ